MYISGGLYFAYNKHHICSHSILGMKAVNWNLRFCYTKIFLPTSVKCHSISFLLFWFLHSNHLKSIPIPKTSLHILSFSYCFTFFPLIIILKITPGMWSPILPSSARENMTVFTMNCKMIEFHLWRYIGDENKVIDTSSFLTTTSSEIHYPLHKCFKPPPLSIPMDPLQSTWFFEDQISL